MTVKDIVIVGSHCIPNLKRKPKDVDVITSIDGFNALVDSSVKNGLNLKEIKDTRNGRAAIFDKVIIDAEIIGISELHPSWALSLARESSSETMPFMGFDIPKASKDFVYTLKMSHRYLRNSPHFLKTMEDIWRLRLENNAKIVNADFYREREKSTYRYGHPKLKVSKAEFFSPEMPYEYDHDSIHRAVAVQDAPAYTRYMVDGEQVLTSRAKFDSLDRETKLLGVLEESYVLALERSIIPFKTAPGGAFNMALSKVCTSITSGWFREFAWENYFAVKRLYNPNFVEKFEAAKARGDILPFDRTAAMAAR